MKLVLSVVEGVVAGILAGICVICVGDLISGTWLGIAISIGLCVTLGLSINGLEGALAGLISGSIAVLIGNMVSQSHFGMGCTIFLSIFIGGITGWELSQQRTAQQRLSKTDNQGANRHGTEGPVFCHSHLSLARCGADH